MPMIDEIIDIQDCHRQEPKCSLQYALVLHSERRRLEPQRRWSAPNWKRNWKCKQNHSMTPSYYRIFEPLHPSRCPSRTLQVSWRRIQVFVSNLRRCRCIQYRTQCTRATWERLSWRKWKRMIKIGRASTGGDLYMDMIYILGARWSQWLVAAGI